MDAITPIVKTMLDSSRFFKLPLYAQKVLGRTGGFANYDVVYDGNDQIQYLMARAKACGVVLNDGKPLDIDADSESCKGKLLNCFVYLSEYLKADAGYIGGITMRIDDLSSITDNELADFCIWINKFLTDFLEGMKHNAQLKHKVNIIYGLEEDEEDVPSTSELRDKISAAKEEAKKVKSPADAKKALDGNREKIEQVSKKLKGKDKENFDKIVSAVEDYANGKKLDEGEGLVKVISGLLAIVLWLCGFSAFSGAVMLALSPIIGPILTNAIKKIG